MSFGRGWERDGVEGARLVLQDVAAAHAHARSVEQAALRSIAHDCTALAASDEGVQDKCIQKKVNRRGVACNGMHCIDLLPRHKTPLSPPNESLRM